MKRTVAITILVLLFIFSSFSINYADTIDEEVEDIEMVEESISDTNMEDNENVDEEKVEIEKKEIDEEILEQSADEVVSEDEKRLVEINKQWYMVVNNKIDYHYTGLGKNQNGIWYMQDGVITYKYNGVVTDETGTYIVEESHVPNVTKMMEINSKWRMIVNGKVDYTYTGIGKNYYGTWYIENGGIDYSYTDTYFEGDLAYIVKENKVLASVSKDTNRLVEINKEWYMVVNNKIDYNYTGLGQNQNGMWYMQNGKITYKYAGIVTDETGTYLVEQSHVPNVTKMMEIDSKWRMIINGKVDYNYTGICKNYYGTWYIENGEIDYNYTGTYFEGDIAYIVEENKVYATVTKDTTKMLEINKEWRMIINGEVDYNYTGIGKNYYGTWYIENGRIDYSCSEPYFEVDTAYIIEKNKVLATVPKDENRLVEINKEWYMVVNNKIDYHYTGLGRNQNGIWYMQNGKITYKYAGIVTDETGTYLVEQSHVPNITKMIEIDTEWYMLINGKVEENYTGVGQNKNGMWYFENGKISYNFTDTYFEGNLAYIAEESRVYATVAKDTTKMLEINKEWRMIINGKVDYHHTGLEQNQNGKWYFEDGKITYTYNSNYTDVDGLVYSIVNSRLKDLISVPGYPATMYVSGPNQNVKYLSDTISVEGWALSLEKNDKILIYVDGKYVGEATREQNEGAFEQDINNEFGGKDSNPLPGFYFNLSNLKLKVGDHRLKIVNVASDGNTIMQTREVDFNIFAITKSKGIDVSNHQGIIDWDAVKNSGVTFAIIKICEYWPNAQKIHYDKYFERNYAECRRLGIAVGGYVYTYAFNSGEATLDANVCLDIIRGKKFDLPIYYDIEDPSIVRAVESGETNANMLTDAVLTFCNIIKNAGYQSGVYTYLNFFERFLNAPLLEKYCSIWVAQWSNRNDYPGKYDFWQYSSNGSVPGINGRVDLDWYYPKK